MTKIKVVLNHQDWTVFHGAFYDSIFPQYFDFEWYDPDQAYDSQRTLFATNTIDLDPWTADLARSGHKIIVDNLWEQPTPSPFYRILDPYWFWYNQCLINHTLGYINYEPDRTYEYMAFMPMRVKKPHRDKLVSALAHHLDSMIYSYVERGQYLPNDMPHDLNMVSEFQQNFHPTWYNQTCFSIVSETMVDSDRSLLVTEKTFKPLGFGHPLMVYGQAGVLDFLRGLGFETYETLFDESYDTIVDKDQRLAKIITNIDNYVRQPYDHNTMNKIQHNRAHLNNLELVHSRMVDEIINPLLEYAET